MYASYIYIICIIKQIIKEIQTGLVTHAFNQDLEGRDGQNSVNLRPP